ncbi:UNVERIFIED_CONTAM: hypothetical protein FKN15_043669 [Acipenser sinensis]
MEINQISTSTNNTEPNNTNDKGTAAIRAQFLTTREKFHEFVDSGGNAAEKKPESKEPKAEGGDDAAAAEEETEELEPKRIKLDENLAGNDKEKGGGETAEKRKQKDKTKLGLTAFSYPIAFIRSRGLQAFLLYPVTLKIHHASTDRLFHSPDDAQAALDSLGLAGPPQDQTFSHGPDNGSIRPLRGFETTTMQREFSSFIQEFKTLKTDLTVLHTSVIGNKRAITACEARIDQIAAKMADLEDRNRRNNLRLVGLKEGDEGSNPTDFLSKTLPLWFPTLSGKTIEISVIMRLIRMEGMSLLCGA